MAFRVGVVFALGEAFFISMLLLGCRLEASINGLRIGLTVYCYSHCKGEDFGEDLRLFVNTVVGPGY